ncbi:MAG: fibrillarin-like rRNA/tRNA 2'-O-methyltransferase [Thermoplasmata archaeon]|nr:fibrillarin-like rRNA/tRNA 2'-O-methyltransferase [Thermoplasmata archaeon]
MNGDKPDGLKFVDGQPYTRNLVAGISVYGESLKKISGEEYRFWDAKRSKLAAYLKRRGKVFPFDADTNLLYLGAASGTTVSHLSDLIIHGKILAVEMSRIPFTKLLGLSEQRKNIIPVQADANQTGSYKFLVGQADVMYQDIAQKNQTEIFIRNSEMLKKGGTGFLAVKARCIDVSQAPEKIYGQCIDELEEAGFIILDKKDLGPYEKDHAMLVVEKVS